MNLWVVVSKEILHLRRDRRALLILAGFPAIVLILYGYALNFDVHHVPLGVVDLDRTRASRDYLAAFLHGEYFDLVATPPSRRELADMLHAGTVRAGLVIPSGFGRALDRGEMVAVQALMDGSNANTAQTALGYLNAFSLAFAMDMARDRLRAFGAATSGAGIPADLRVLVYYNPTLETARFLVPGLIGIILTIMAVVSTALSLVREKERGTLDMLRVSPLRASEVVIGKTLPYLAISLFASSLVLAVGYGLFGVEVRGSLALLFAMLLLFLFGALAMGVLISSMTDSAQVAFTVSATLTMLPSFILSGFVFPLESMPAAIRLVSYLIPARYILAILRAIILKGEGLSAFWMEFLCLVGFAVLMVSLASLKVRRQMR